MIIQTSHGERLKKYIFDYDRFLEDEKKLRKDYYPPFVKIALLSFSHTNETKAKKGMEEVVENLKSFGDIEIIGCGESPIKKIASKFRYQILLRSKDILPLLKAIENSKNSMCEIDIDPYHLA
mgnify:FL=1